MKDFPALKSDTHSRCVPYCFTVTMCSTTMYFKKVICSQYPGLLPNLTCYRDISKRTFDDFNNIFNMPSNMSPPDVCTNLGAYFTIDRFPVHSSSLRFFVRSSATNLCRWKPRFKYLQNVKCFLLCCTSFQNNCRGFKFSFGVCPLQIVLQRIFVDNLQGGHIQVRTQRI